MSSFDWKNVVTTVAPWIGAALGGPLGSAAVEVVAGTLGLSDKTEGAIKQALSGVTPDQMLALKKADQEFAIKMQELGFSNERDLEQVAAGDRDSARKREMEVKDNTPKILAYAVTLGFFSALLFMMIGEVSNSARDILNYMLGALNTSWVAIISYYYGSTAGSKAKSELLAKAEMPKK